MSTFDDGRFLDINGARLFVEEAGTGAAIVLIHAGICDSRMWDSLWDALVGQYRVIRYDLRGFGESSLPAGDFAHNEDLRALLDHLGIDHAILVGASMGGEVAVACALTIPERIDGLVLINTLAGIDEPSAALRAGWSSVNEAMARKNLDAATEIELTMWVDGPHRSPEDVDPRVRDLVRVMDRRLLERSLEDIEAEEQELDPPIETRLGDVTCPVLVIFGTLDVEDARTSSARMVEAMPDVRMESIDNAAHLPSMERPTEVNALVQAFLDEHQRTKSD